jgi:uncharacterized protein (TIGR00730 family)
MTSNVNDINVLSHHLQELIDRLPTLEHGDLIYQALMTVLQTAVGETDRLDWKILSASLQDLKQGFQVFHPHRHVRKISIFGSARIAHNSAEYQLAVDFARCVTARGFMVMTGAGGGIMEAGNQGAGPGQSFGLNIQLPFEQGANPFIMDDPKLIDFKYFFTRKLFFLRETDAIALFPGGFGTQDEAFECLTLSQTGKSSPMPLVLIDKPGGTYWLEWDAYIQRNLADRHLINPDDRNLYTITDNLETACTAISGFYRVFHSSRFVGDQLVIRLNQPLSEAEIAILNEKFSDIVLSGHIQLNSTGATDAHTLDPQAETDRPDVESLPQLVLHFNQRDYGRLYQMITVLNQMGNGAEAVKHPERK